MSDEMPQPQPLPQHILDAINAHHNKNFTAGNMGGGAVYGLVPYDLAGQRYQNAEDAEEAEENKPRRRRKPRNETP